MCSCQKPVDREPCRHWAETLSCRTVIFSSFIWLGADTIGQCDTSRPAPLSRSQSTGYVPLCGRRSLTINPQPKSSKLSFKKEALLPEARYGFTLLLTILGPWTEHFHPFYLKNPYGRLRTLIIPPRLTARIRHLSTLHASPGPAAQCHAGGDHAPAAGIGTPARTGSRGWGEQQADTGCCVVPGLAYSSSFRERGATG